MPPFGSLLDVDTPPPPRNTNNNTTAVVGGGCGGGLLSSRSEERVSINYEDGNDNNVLKRKSPSPTNSCWSTPWKLRPPNIGPEQDDSSFGKVAKKKGNKTFEGKGDDADLAKEMMTLSVNEREKVFEDIHGVSQPQEETPEFIATCLEDFNKAIKRLPVRHQKMINRATFLRPALETCSKFKLAFLRADDYNATKAAKRLYKYYAMKCELFGTDKIAKRITLDDDFNDDDLYIFKSGYVTLLNVRDQSNRPVMFADTTKINLGTMHVNSIVSRTQNEYLFLVPCFLKTELFPKMSSSSLSLSQFNTKIYKASCILVFTNDYCFRR